MGGLGGLLGGFLFVGFLPFSSVSGAALWKAGMGGFLLVAALPALSRGLGIVGRWGFKRAASRRLVCRCRLV